MNEQGHYHTYVKSDGPTRRSGTRRHHGGGRSLWQCTGCPREAWSLREDGPRYGIYPWKLEEREVEVIMYLIDGRTVPYIAHHMGVSHRAVQNTRHRVKRKMGAETVEEAVAEYHKWELELIGQRMAA